MRKTVIILMAVSFLGGIIAALLLATTFSLHNALKSDLINQNSDTSQEVARSLRPSTAEMLFESTLRSCLSPKCYDKLAGRADDVIRVGILSLPGTGTEYLKEVVKIAAPADSISVIYDSHVPAYGYGKNHGWSRIVRFSRNVLEHSFYLLGDAAESRPDLLQAYEEQIRQVVRWHCRLSHVSAHTKMLTVFTEDLYRRPSFELDRIISFIGLEVHRAKLLQNSEALINRLISETRYNVPLPPYLRQRGLEVLSSELDLTNNLSDWPCLSFRQIGKNNELKLSSLEVAPNCSDSFVHCTVPIDRQGG